MQQKYYHDKKLSDCLKIKNASMAKHRSIYGEGLKTLAPKRMLQRLSR